MCGIGHGIMSARIHIQTDKEHTTWINANSKPQPSQQRRLVKNRGADMDDQHPRSTGWPRRGHVSHGHDAHGHDAHGHQEEGMDESTGSTDHKIICFQYLYTGMIMAAIGGFMAYAFRMQLLFPVKKCRFTVGELREYNVLTNHGTIMIFWVAMPVLIAAFETTSSPL